MLEKVWKQAGLSRATLEISVEFLSNFSLITHKSQSIQWLSSKESKRTLGNTSRKLRINFQISTLLESGQTPGFSRAASKESKRTLEVPERSIGGF